MRELNFSISKGAICFIKRLIPAGVSSDEFVVTMSPVAGATTWSLDNTSLEQVIADIKEAAANADVSSMTFQWEIGLSRRTRFPPEDIHSFGGVLCFVPPDLKSVLDGCTLVVSEDQLRIQRAPTSS